MPSFAVSWEADYPPEFGGGRGRVVSAEKCREAERDRDQAQTEVKQLRGRPLAFLAGDELDALVAVMDMRHHLKEAVATGLGSLEAVIDRERADRDHAIDSRSSGEGAP